MTPCREILVASALVLAAPPARAVVIGFVDTGVSPLHPDFFDAEGHTRIRALVDMTRSPRGRHPELEQFGGAAFTAGEIDAAAAGRALDDGAVLPGDPEGHGSHVASIAAREAPEASLFVVRTDGADRGARDVAAGAELFFEWASSRGEPAVLNLSLGRARGPRDGSAWIERLLDDLVGSGIPGRVVVASAGNDGWLPTHVRTTVEAGCTATIDLAASASWDSEGEGRVTLEVAGPTGPRMPAISVVAPEGARLGPVPFGSRAIEDAGSTTFLVVPPDDGAGDERGRPRTLVTIEAAVAAAATGTWRVELDGPGTFDAWIADPTEGLEVMVAAADFAADSRFSLRTPSTADAVIVVAASSEGGGVRRAPFSSLGPTLDGRPKPDVAAPGENVPGALADESILSRADLAGLWTEDGRHIVLSGTSQAAPRVSAAAAKLLAAAPGLDAAQVRALIVASAVPPDGAGWTPEVGFGLLDVEAALARLGSGALELDEVREREALRLAREIADVEVPAICAAPPLPAPTCSALPAAGRTPLAILPWLALLVVRRCYRRPAWGRRGEGTTRVQLGTRMSPAHLDGRGPNRWAAHRMDRAASAASR